VSVFVPGARNSPVASVRSSLGREFAVFHPNSSTQASHQSSRLSVAIPAALISEMSPSALSMPPNVGPRRPVCASLLESRSIERVESNWTVTGFFGLERVSFARRKVGLSAGSREMTELFVISFVCPAQFADFCADGHSPHLLTADFRWGFMTRPSADAVRCSGAPKAVRQGGSLLGGLRL
jgi:hypothetical protein